VSVRRLVAAAAVLIVAVTACDGGSSSNEAPPEDRLAAAKERFDSAEYIGFTLVTEQLPDGLEGLLSATGTGTHAPAFTGEVKVQTAATDISAPLVAVDDRVYAEFPFVGWSTIDPADYGAPDPANLMDTDAGISSLFTATEDPEAGDESRDGDEVLTTIDGTLPGDAVQQVFPSAATDDFTVSYRLTSDDDVASADISGPFYNGSDDVTYTIQLDLEADQVDIQAPA
jgi:lipoprotein LprG